MELGNQQSRIKAARRYARAAFSFERALRSCAYAPPGSRPRIRTDLKPADPTRRVFLLLLSGVVSCCCCLSRQCCSRSARAAENLTAHRFSHLLSRSRGILLITQKLRVRGCPRSKVSTRAGLQRSIQNDVSRNQRWRTVHWRQSADTSSPRIRRAPAAFPESWKAARNTSMLRVSRADGAGVRIDVARGGIVIALRVVRRASVTALTMSAFRGKADQGRLLLDFRQ
jgi:hypothetical protein